MAKIRVGFVSNSSSSSFVCSVCGEIESGMDASASDFDMKLCVNGHYFHNGCSKLKSPSVKEMTKTILDAVENLKYLSDDEKKEYKDRVTECEKDTDALSEIIDELFDDGIPECECPICSFVQIDSGDAVAYLYKKYSLTDKILTEEIKRSFDDYKSFKKYLK
jgi:hypothetical protein